MTTFFLKLFYLVGSGEFGIVANVRMAPNGKVAT
jgi:hypothetical protein